MEKNNKLIAEFMGINVGEGLQYHNSWDWLMPVVIKCFEVFGNTDVVDYTKLNDAILTCNIDEVNKVVVELISELNNK
jgi:hypothetical protein